jgi:hypothetical protein
MARMIPAHFDESTTSAAERLMYYRLQNHLEDDWTVIHSLPWLDDSRPRLGQGECDFLLLHPRHGLLVLEVKSGTPQYDGPTDQWRYDDGTRLKDPFNQARRAMHFLRELLENRSSAWRQAELPYGCAVAFPDARAVRGSLRPDMIADLLLLEPDLDDLQARVIHALGRFAESAPTPRPEAVSAALEALRPSLRLVATLAPVIERASRELVRLTEEQAEVLEGLAGNRRLVVRGGAGTGKTLLIVTEARRLAAEGRRVLVLCFNRPLAAYLRELLADVAGQPVAAATFHDHCLALLREAGIPAPGGSGKESWDRLAEAALEALPQTKGRFDAVLVDEAQDFEPDWWLVVEELLADTATSHFHLFLDEHQNLYGREVQLPFTEPEFRLRRNCRNTRPIAAFARRAIGLVDEASLARLPAGPAPVVHEVDSAEAERDAVRRVVHELIHERGLAPAQLVILGCHKIGNSSFAEVRRLGNFSVRDVSEPDAVNAIRYSTVHKFKGLEADVVLLVGIGEPSRHYGADDWLRFVYVGSSRALAVLHVFARTGVLPA